MRDKEQQFTVRNTSFLEPFAPQRIMGNEQEKWQDSSNNESEVAWFRKKKISHSKTSISFSPVQYYAGTAPTYILCQWSALYHICPNPCITLWNSNVLVRLVLWANGFLNTYVWTTDKWVPCVSTAILATTKYILCQKPDSAFLIWFFQAISLHIPLSRDSQTT